MLSCNGCLGFIECQIAAITLHGLEKPEYSCCIVPGGDHPRWRVGVPVCLLTLKKTQVNAHTTTPPGSAGSLCLSRCLLSLLIIPLHRVWGQGSPESIPAVIGSEVGGWWWWGRPGQVANPSRSGQKRQTSTHTHTPIANLEKAVKLSDILVEGRARSFNGDKSTGFVSVSLITARERVGSGGGVLLSASPLQRTSRVWLSNYAGGDCSIQIQLHCLVEWDALI